MSRDPKSRLVASGPVFRPLTAAMLVGGVSSVGSKNPTVTTPWAFSAGAMSCAITVSVGTDGITEGYPHAVLAAVMLAEIGVTEDDLRNGVKSLVVKMPINGNPLAGCNAGVAFGTSSDEEGGASTLSGGGGGFRGGSSTPSNVSPMAFDTSQEKVGTSSDDYGNGVMCAVYTWFDGYVKVWVGWRETADSVLKYVTYDVSGFASRTAPIWMFFWCGGATANPVAPNFSPEFAVIDGPNFQAYS